MSLAATVLAFIGISLFALSIFEVYKERSFTEKFFNLLLEGSSVISVASAILFLFFNSPNASLVLYVMPLAIPAILIMKRKFA